MATSMRSFVCRAYKQILSLRGSALMRRNLATAASADSKTSSAWRLASAVCIERMPLITQELHQIENEFMEMLNTVEVEESLLSDHELNHRKDLQLAERRKREDFEETDASVSHQTVLEKEDIWEGQLQKFQPASRITEADEKNDLTSSNRKLDRKLVMLVKQNLGGKERWALPQEFWQEGELMIEAAERAISRICGDRLKVQFLSNAPCVCIRRPHLNEPGGVKVFVYKAQLADGSMKHKDKETEHVWVTREDISSYCNISYALSVRRSILEL